LVVVVLVAARGEGHAGIDVGWQTCGVVIVRGTRRFLDRVGGPTASAELASTTVLGDWYANVLPWRPQVGLFVNENTLLPVLVPFAPARTAAARFATVLAEVLPRHGSDAAFICDELAQMSDVSLAPTSNRSVVGVMNEFAFLAGHWRGAEPVDLVDLSVRLAATPCSPLFRRHVSPDRELRAVLAEHAH
jgi:hypothetical protein